jgi:hypothetical protein
MTAVTKEICKNLRAKGRFDAMLCRLCGVRKQSECDLKQEKSNVKVRMYAP